MRTLNRILAVGALAAAGLAGYLLNSREEQKEMPEIAAVKTVLTFQDIKREIGNPERYVLERVKANKEIESAHREGKIFDVFYNLAGDNLVRALRAAHSKVINDEERLEAIVSEGYGVYNDVLRKMSVIDKRAKYHQNAMTFPVNQLMFGTKSPVSISVSPTIFASVNMDSDKDFDVMLGHELVHVDDIYHGINLNGVQITNQTIASGEISLGFLSPLMEVRAFHDQLADFYRAYKKDGKGNCSDSCFGDAVKSYTRHVEESIANAKKPLERKVLKLQLDEFNDVELIREGERIRIIFDPKGERRYFLIGEEK